MWLHIKSKLPPSSTGQNNLDIAGFFAQAGNPDKFIIGRDEECQLKIADEKISRRHCYIERTKEGAFKLYDNNSINGCTVNSIKVTETILSESDIISICNYEISVSKEPIGTDILIQKIKEKATLPALSPQPSRPQKYEAPDLKKAPKDIPFRLLVASFLLIVSLIAFIVISSGNQASFFPTSPKNQPADASSQEKTTRPPKTGHKNDVVIVPKQPAVITPATPTSGPSGTPAEKDAEFERHQKALKEQRNWQETEQQARQKIELERQALLQKAQDEQRLLKIEKEKWPAVKATIAQEILKYQYENAIKLAKEFTGSIQSAAVRQESTEYLETIRNEAVFFSDIVENLTGGPSRKKITIDTAGDIWINKADMSGFEGNVAGLSGSIYSRQWKDTPAKSILTLFPRDLSKDKRFYSATFCYHHNIPGDGERILIYCFRNYPDQKDKFSRFLARHKNIPMPDGGFAEHQGQLVTAEEKSYLEKGYVKYKDKWMTYDDMMLAQGMVKFQGKWVTAEEKAKIEARLTALTSLKKQLAPKGTIDKPGADREKLPWDKARIKETDHYIIKSNLSQEALDDLCFLMECFYFEARKIFKVSRDPSKKLNISVFRESRDYYANGGPAGSQGAFRFQGSNKEIMTFYQPPQTTMVLLHEGTHQFVNIVCNATVVPIWINEGLATYYESSKFEGSSLKTNIVNQSRLRLIKDLINKKDVPRLEDIINIRQANFTIYEYAHTWSLLYFFMNYYQGKYSDALEAYFEAIKKKGFENRPHHKQMFEDAFKVKFEVLEQQWEDYIIKLR